MRRYDDDDEYDQAISNELATVVPDDVIILPAPVNTISIAHLSDALSEGMGTLPSVHIGIVCMTKKPRSFERWLQYHHHALQARRFYLRVEDTPELEEMLTSPPWRDFCTCTFHNGTVRSWTGQTERQAKHVRDAVGAAASDGITHLLHIDDDELLFLPSGLRVLQREIGRLPRGIVNLHALTLEALVPRDACTDADGGVLDLDGSDATHCPYARCCAFRHRRASYTAYGANPVSAGKSFGVLSCAGLAPASPHHFSADPFTSPHAGFLRGTRVLAGHVAVVLHYESCSFGRWRSKFAEYARHHRSAREEEGRELEAEQQSAAEAVAAGGRLGRPRRGAHHSAQKEREARDRRQQRKDPSFGFYRQSMFTCLRLVLAEEEAAGCTSSLVLRQRVADCEAACLRLWSSNKLEPASVAMESRDARTLADQSRPPQVLEGAGVTLIRPVIDPVTGAVRLPHGHQEAAAPPLGAARQLPPLPKPQAVTWALPPAVTPAEAAPPTMLPPALPPVLPCEVPPAQQGSDWRRAADAPSQHGEPSGTSTWQLLAKLAGLPAAAGDKLARCAASRPPPLAGPAAREQLDEMARRASLPMGQRLKLRGLATDCTSAQGG